MYWERERKAMIRPDHPRLSIARQCRLVSIGRSSYYHEARGESAENLALMALIDCQFLETPFYGARQMRSEEHTSELQSLMRTSYAVFCVKKKKNRNTVAATTH